MNIVPADRALPRRADRTAAEAFGYDVLGPILAEFSLRLWLFQRLMPKRDEACLLFCARGGLRLQALYERLLHRTGLPLPLPTDNLMISRLVAARTVANAPTEALLDELGREFKGRAMSEVAVSLTQRDDLDLSAAWNDTFEPDAFRRLMTETDTVRDAIATQNARFFDHLAGRTKGRTTVVLCDTGLYGSTIRLLASGRTDFDWHCLQFARSNYKGYSAPHFARTVGLSIERDRYAPWDVRSSALRFWHLIEAVLEPALPSVRTFASTRWGPISNLEIAGWQERVATDHQGFFSGALAYVDDLTPGRLPDIDDEALRAWRALKRKVTRPRLEDLAVLNFEDRSSDFGRAKHVALLAGNGGTLATIQASLWREGALVQQHPSARLLTLPLVELAYSLRAVGGLVKSRHGRHGSKPAIDWPEVTVRTASPQP